MLNMKIGTTYLIYCLLSVETFQPHRRLLNFPYSNIFNNISAMIFDNQFLSKHILSGYS